MRSHSVLPVLAMLGALACSAPEVYTPVNLEGFKGARIHVVTAVHGSADGPIDPKDRFAAGEPICVYSTFRWRSGPSNAPLTVTAKCYKDGHLVYVGRYTSRLEVEPWNIWMDVPPGLLGTGIFKVDVCAGDIVLDSHAFEISEAAPLPPKK